MAILTSGHPLYREPLEMRGAEILSATQLQVLKHCMELQLTVASGLASVFFNQAFMLGGKELKLELVIISS